MKNVRCKYGGKHTRVTRPQWELSGSGKAMCNDFLMQRQESIRNI